MKPGFTSADVPDQTGRCIVVTGANAGIGFEAAHALAARGARVLLGCRDEGRASRAIARIAAVVPHADLAWLPLDLADLDSVRRAAAMARDEPRIDVLLHNAGVMSPPLTRTRQGRELQLAVNHLAAFALTALLLPKLARAGGARVIVTSSLAHRRTRIGWDDLDAERRYRRWHRYAESKLANLLFVSELDRRLRAAGVPIGAIGCHPGIAATRIGRFTGPFAPLFALTGLLFNSAARGAWPALQAATDPLAAPGGYYGPQGLRGVRGRSGPATRSAAAQDVAAAARLWDWSIAATGIDPALPPAPTIDPRIVAEEGLDF